MSLPFSFLHCVGSKGCLDPLERTFSPSIIRSFTPIPSSTSPGSRLQDAMPLHYGRVRRHEVPCQRWRQEAAGCHQPHRRGPPVHQPPTDQLRHLVQQSRDSRYSEPEAHLALPDAQRRTFCQCSLVQPPSIGGQHPSGCHASAQGQPPRFSGTLRTGGWWRLRCRERPHDAVRG